MLGITGEARIFLYADPVDMRKGFEGLSAIVEHALKENPSSGAYFVFLNRYRNRMKVLYWDVDGLALWYKRLEKGTFPCKSEGKTSINRRDFFMLLEGITPKRLSPRYNIA